MLNTTDRPTALHQMPCDEIIAQAFDALARDERPVIDNAALQLLIAAFERDTFVARATYESDDPNDDFDLHQNEHFRTPDYAAFAAYVRSNGMDVLASIQGTTCSGATIMLRHERGAGREVFAMSRCSLWLPVLALALGIVELSILIVTIIAAVALVAHVVR